MANLKSAWKSIFNINTQYIKGFPLEDSMDGEYPSLVLKGIQNLMRICGMHRVFTEEDMNLFLCRLVILHRRENAVKELEELKNPLSYTFNFEKSKATLDDIFRYHEIEIYDYTNHYISEEGFRYKLSVAWSEVDSIAKKI